MTPASSLMRTSFIAMSMLLAACGLPTASGRAYLYGQRTLNAAPPSQEPVAPVSDGALVIGWGATVGEGLKAAISYKRGAWVSALYIQRDNGKKIPAKGNIVQLAPGNHHLDIFCGLHIGGMSWPGSALLDVDVKSAHVYELHAHNESTTCVPTILDITVPME